jgi:hypothetical protein
LASDRGCETGGAKLLCCHGLPCRPHMHVACSRMLLRMRAAMCLLPCARMLLSVVTYCLPLMQFGHNLLTANCCCWVMAGASCKRAGGLREPSTVRHGFAINAAASTLSSGCTVTAAMDECRSTRTFAPHPKILSCQCNHVSGSEY